MTPSSTSTTETPSNLDLFTRRELQYHSRPVDEMDPKNASEALGAMEGMGFDDASKREIQTALLQGQRQAQAHNQLLAFTSMCWDKCITGTPGSRFARGEEACIVNCIERFVDTSEFLLGQIQRQQQLQQAQKS